MTFKLLYCIFVGLTSIVVSFCNAESISSSGELILQLSDSTKPTPPLNIKVNNVKGTGEPINSKSELKLQLSNPAKPIVPLKDNIKLNNVKGTLFGWVHLDKSSSSRALMSARWDKDNKESSYMVLSDGWWEHKNSKGFYFVLDNKQYAFCHINNFLFPSNRWVFIAVTWGQFNQQSFCQIYIDGQFYVENKTNIKLKRSTEVTSQFSDELTDNPAQRSAQGMSSGLFYHSSALSWTEINALYSATKNMYKNIEALPSAPSAYFRHFTQRILFDEDIYWALSKKNTDEVLAEVEASNFNVFIPCVWHGKGAYFKNSKGIYDPLVKSRIDTGDDPLRYLLLQAKKKGIKIIPWFTVVLRESDILPEYADAGTEGAFNVHNAQFRAFISNLIIEAINDYQLEDVNLDYIRSIDICLTEKCKQEFKQQYKKDLLTEFSRPSNASDFSESISSWNNYAVTDILKRIRNAVNKSVKISVDAIPLNKELQRQGQESVGWLNNGLVDVVFSMNYSRNIDFEIMALVKKKVVQGKVIPIISTYDKVSNKFVPREAAVLGEIITKIDETIGNDGIAIYHRKTLTQSHVLYLNPKK